MSESVPLPPACEEVAKPQNSNSNWEAWYRKFIALEFNQDEAIKYAKLFVNNDVEINMIPDLNHGVLKAIGIEKAGHCIRILRLQNQNSIQTSARARAAAVAQPVITTPRCAWHPDIVANKKCCKCNRLLCLHCRRQERTDDGVRCYCQNCYDECIIL